MDLKEQEWCTCAHMKVIHMGASHEGVCVGLVQKDGEWTECKCPSFTPKET